MNLSQRYASQAVPFIGLLMLGLAGTLGVFSGGAMAAISIAGAVLLFGSVSIADKKLPDLNFCLLKSCSVVFAGIMLLNLQAAWPETSWHATGQLVSILLPLSLLSSRRVQEALACAPQFNIWSWLFLVGMLALGLELALGNPLQIWLRDEAVPTKYNRGLSYAILLIWPVLALLWQQGRHKHMMVFVLALLPLLIFTTSRASQLAIMLAVPVLLISLVMPRLVAALLGGVALLMLAWPFGSQAVFNYHPDWIQHLPDSWKARVEIWDFMAYHIMERPWLGWGLGSSWKLLPTISPHSSQYIFTTGPVGHPHNAFTQLWVELGLSGLMLAAFLVIGSLRSIIRLSARLVPFALAAWITAFVLAMVAYDFWTDSLLSAFALTAFLFALAQYHQKAAGPSETI